MSKITIVLADDHRLVRQGLRALLEGEKDFLVVGETGDGIEALRLAEELRPRVLVLDLMMPGLNGLEIMRRLHGDSPQPRVVIVSMHANRSLVQEAFQDGACAYVPKDSTTQHLIQAVRAAAEGRRYLCPPFSESAVEKHAEEGAGESPVHDGI